MVGCGLIVFLGLGFSPWWELAFFFSVMVPCLVTSGLNALLYGLNHPINRSIYFIY